MTEPRHCLAILATIALLAGCQQAPEGDAEAETPGGASPTVVAALPRAEPPLDREALLFAVTRAASAAAGGVANGEAVASLDGKPFELRTRFGCAGQAIAHDEALSWSYDDRRGVINLRAMPDLSARSPLIRSVVGDRYEAVEGFWIRHPWLLVAACPAPQSARNTQLDANAADAGRNVGANGSNDDISAGEVGIAQFYTANDARTHRRGNRAYQASKALGDGETPSNAGYDLIVSGRLRGLDDGRVITCNQHRKDERPSCVISAEFYSVAIARADNGETLAEWSRN